MKNKKYNIVIIGGGISGLYLANLFQKKLGTGANNVAIFEKSYRVGGRVKSQVIEGSGDDEGDGGVVIEEGAGRIMANHRRVRGLIKRYGLEGNMVWKTPQKDAKLSQIVAKVRKYAATRRDLCKQLTYLELARLCLTPAEIEYYLANYGFGDEIHYLQAGHAVRQFAGDLRHDRKFFVMRGNGGNGGLEGIVRGLEEECNERKISIHMQHLLKRVTYIGSSSSHPYQLEFEEFNTFKKVVVYAREIVLCVPPSSLRHITFDLGNEKNKEQICESVERITNMVHEGTLIRIYAKYRDAWFRNMKNSVIGRNIIRNIIPISTNKNSAIIQYYSDYNQAKELEQYRLAGAGNEKIIREVIQREIKREFGVGPDPEWLKIFYWNAGVHHWKPNVDIDREIREIQWNTFTFGNMNRNQHKIGIVGEAFCHNQGWIEGTLENAEEYYKEWVKRRKMRLQRRLRIKGGYTRNEVAKHNSSDDAWTIIHNRVYDITKFIEKHPGGLIILNAAGQDGTKYFEYIKHPEYVQNIMEKYCIGNVI